MRATLPLMLIVWLSLHVGQAGEKIAEIKGWGKIVDPIGDCDFKEKDGTLTLNVPGTYHDFTPLPGYMNNAARIYQEVEGDFVAEVRVSGTVLPDQGTELPGRDLSFRAGSLLIWQDDKNFIRLDRAGMARDGKNYFTVYCHVFTGGNRPYESAPFVKDEPTVLGIERRGNRFRAFAKQGEKMTTFPVQTVELTPRVQISLGGINVSTQTLELGFDVFTIRQF